MTITDQQLPGKLWRKIPKGPDLELRIYRTTIDNLAFVELRDWILSKDEPGKGYLIPEHKLAEVLEVLQDVARYSSTAGSKPGKGQGKLL